jgi:PAS domain S-box-containing protein
MRKGLRVSSPPQRRGGGLQALVRRATCIPADTPCAEAYALFRDHPGESSVVVVDGLSPTGLLVKSRFMLRMSGHYGWALYHRRPVSTLADAEPLTLPPETGLAQASTAILARDQEHRYDDVLVVDGNHVLYGILPVAALLERLAALHEQQATGAIRALESQRGYAESLRSSEQFLRTVVANAPLALFTVDLMGVVTFTEGRGRLPLRAEQGRVVGRSMFEFAWDLPEVVYDLERALGGEASSAVIEVDGRLLEAAYAPLRDELGMIGGALCVTTDVTERKQAERQLLEALERDHSAAQHLRELDELKTTFLRAVSHDLRTPLASVLGLALTVQRGLGTLPEGDVVDLVERLIGNARRLDRIVADLLDLERLAQSAVALRRRPTDVSALVHEVLEGLDVLDGRPVTVDGGPVVVAVDPPKVERIVENLLANAAKHTPAGAPLWIRTEPERDGVLVVVEDAGPGVPDELKEAVFRPFRQGPTAAAHAPGSGVGLSLVARFAELHGGRAWVEDRPGGGASFHVLLPGK